MFAIPRLYAMIGAGVVVALFLAWVWRVNHLRAEYKAALVACEANHRQFVADVQAKTEAARQADLANKQRVESAQNQIRSENDAQIRRRIAAAVASVRAAAPKADSSGRGTPPVSSPADPAANPAGTGGSPELVARPSDLAICATNTAKAIAWQDWWANVSAIPR